MNRTQLAIVLGQSLSFLLIVVFIFANQQYDLMSIFGGTPSEISARAAYTAACLVAIVGVVSIWITVHYLGKSNSMRDMIVVCAWTHRVKVNGQWISIRDFLTDQLGYAVSHGMCPDQVEKMRQELDSDWRNVSKDETAGPEVGRLGTDSGLAGS